jgi:mannose-6-phosphate isomerase-like protein (cupin superfamily)
LLLFKDPPLVPISLSMNVIRPFFRSILVAVIVFSGATTFGQNLDGQKSAEKLKSVLFRWEDFPVTPADSAGRREIINRPTETLARLNLAFVTLKPGMNSSLEHGQRQEELIWLKEGSLEVIIKEKPEKIGPGSVVFFASNDLRKVRNVEPVPASYLVIDFEPAPSRSTAVPKAKSAAGSSKFGSAAFDWEKLVVEKTDPGFRRGVFNSPTATCMNLESHVITLDPGQIANTRWHHPDEELLVVKEGLFDVTLNGKAQRVGPGAIFFFASNDEHGMENVGTGPALYTVFRFVTEATPQPIPTPPAP